jgi:serine/threonine protein kinase
MASVARTSRGVGKGTDGYKAPELYTAAGGDMPVDVYAFGMLLYEMVTRTRPYAGIDSLAVIKAVESGERPDLANVTAALAAFGDAGGRAAAATLAMLMKDCWRQHPEQRPSMLTVVLELRRDCGGDGGGGRAKLTAEAAAAKRMSEATAEAKAKADAAADATAAATADVQTKADAKAKADAAAAAIAAAAVVAEVKAEAEAAAAKAKAQEKAAAAAKKKAAKEEAERIRRAAEEEKRVELLSAQQGGAAMAKAKAAVRTLRFAFHHPSFL